MTLPETPKQATERDGDPPSASVPSPSSAPWVGLVYLPPALAVRVDAVARQWQAEEPGAQLEDCRRLVVSAALLRGLDAMR